MSIPPKEDPEAYGHRIASYEVQSTTIEVTGSTSSPVFPGGGRKRNALPAKKRTSITPESKEFLERVFKAKRTPNSTERKVIAEKCGLTPLQVRVWFTNKRMRNKEG